VRTIAALLLLCCTVSAGEVEECAAIAARYGLQKEVRLDDGSRVDLMSEDMAIEVDWSEKWAEGVGQSLYYGLKTERQPGVLLLRKKGQAEASHRTFVERCKLVCQSYSIVLYEAVEGDTTVTTVYPKPAFRGVQ
jgi:hypothetical protein